MTDTSRLVLARIIAEMNKGTSPADVLHLVASIFRQQAAADATVSTPPEPPQSKEVIG